MKKIIISLIILLLYIHVARGQFISGINPANTGDPRFIFANPALPDSGCAPYVVAGYQRLFSGISDRLSQRMIGFVIPTDHWGRFAVIAPGFASPHFDQSALEFRYAYSFPAWRTTVGLNAGTMLTVYDRKKYDLQDPGDPLLLGNQSINVLNLGLGVTMQPVDRFTLGLSADHLNLPRLSFEGGMRRDIRWQVGAMYEWKMLRPMLQWEQEEGEQYWSFGAEAWLWNLPVLDAVMARAFWGSELFTLGGGLRFKYIRLDFLYDIPLGELGEITSGSPQVVMTYQFEMPEPGCGPPVAIIHALQDTLRRWLPNDSLKMQPLDSIQWQSANSFSQHDKVYEILNPQANPYANYLFFKENSNELTGDPDQVKELCRLFLRDYAGEGAVMVLKAHINSGRGGNCGDPCEQDFSLARRRVDQAKSLLSSFGVPEQKLVDSTDSDPRFPKCIEHEFILKSERQRVDVTISKNGKRLPLPLIFANVEKNVPVCSFNLSLSQAPCGWKDWLVGVWRKTDDTGLSVVWSHRGNGQVDETLNWTWPPSLENAGPFSGYLYYKLNVQDTDGNAATSSTGSIFYEQHYRPTRLLILYNFDRPTEPLGENPLNPRENPNELVEIPASCESIADKDKLFESLPLKSLNALVAAVKKGDITIKRIVGHTDAVGDKAHNRKLSYARALAIKCYLEDKGVRIGFDAVDGVGEEAPLVNNNAPAGRWLNRRVEIIVRYNR